MADLRVDRLEPAPAFTYVGIDVFGPWMISTRKTCGGAIQSKRWAVIFSCLVIRAVHIEVIEDMSSSCFVNALRRFVALRGEVKLIRSDCGTNFVRAAKDIGANMVNLEDANMQSFLTNHGTSWQFNAPHSSHMTGAWERLIGVSRRILDSMSLDVQRKNLTHEVLTTLMAEICAIINARPLTGVSADPRCALILTPAMLLNMKSSQTVDSFKFVDFNVKNILKSQWRCVQLLANTFWKRWRQEYLSSVQPRRKWQSSQRNLCVGDIVLLIDKTSHRNEWPLGIIADEFPSKDATVRKVEVRVEDKLFRRPACEVVLLVPVA